MARLIRPPLSPTELRVLSVSPAEALLRFIYLGNLKDVFALLPQQNAWEPLPPRVTNRNRTCDLHLYAVLPTELWRLYVLYKLPLTTQQSNIITSSTPSVTHRLSQSRCSLISADKFFYICSLRKYCKCFW